MAAAIAAPPSSGAVAPDSAPWKAPIGVRRAATKTMGFSTHCGLRLRPGRIRQSALGGQNRYCGLFLFFKQVRFVESGNNSLSGRLGQLAMIGERGVVRGYGLEDVDPEPAWAGAGSGPWASCLAYRISPRGRPASRLGWRRGTRRPENGLRLFPRGTFPPGRSRATGPSCAALTISRASRVLPAWACRSTNRCPPRRSRKCAIAMFRISPLITNEKREGRNPLSSGPST